MESFTGPSVCCSPAGWQRWVESASLGPFLASGFSCILWVVDMCSGNVWTTKGTIAAALALAFFVCILAGGSLSEQAESNGEVGLFYQVDSCYSLRNSFNISSAGQTWDAYLLRDVSPSTPVSTACPTDPTAPVGTIDITMEPDDGKEYRTGDEYRPVVMLPQDTYASMAFDIVDAAGNVVLPTYNVWLGPDQAYPWTADATLVPLDQPAPLVSRETCGVCNVDLPCSGKSDGMCDDSGPGSEYSICPLGYDCADCGVRTCPPPPPPPSEAERRQLAVEETVAAAATAAPTRKLLFGSLDGAPVASHDRHRDDDVDPDHAATAPGARRLLKGGSSGGSSGGGTSSAGRSSTSGSNRWGSSTPRTYTSTTTTTTAYRSTSGVSYGGRGSYYSYSSTTYYGGYRPYSYGYGRGVVPYNTRFFIIGYWGYGCYSCRYRTCHSCSGCSSRRSCGAEAEAAALANLDRYEIEVPFDTPEDEVGGPGRPRAPPLPRSPPLPSVHAHPLPLAPRATQTKGGEGGGQPSERTCLSARCPSARCLGAGAPSPPSTAGWPADAPHARSRVPLAGAVATSAARVQHDPVCAPERADGCAHHQRGVPRPASLLHLLHQRGRHAGAARRRPLLDRLDRLHRRHVLHRLQL